MKIITFQDIVDLGIQPIQCYEWSNLVIKNKSEYILPPKTSIKPCDGTFLNFMPSMVHITPDRVYAGIKLITRYPSRIPSLEGYILLMDAKTGKNLALMDATWITAMRTGAVAAHSIMLFAKKGFRSIGIMGLGNVSRAAMMTLCGLIPDKELNIKLLKYKNQEQLFMERFCHFDNLGFSLKETPKDLIKGTDVVISGATYLQYNVCEDIYFDEGVFVQPIHTRGFANCDLFFDKVIVDDIAHVRDFVNFDKFKRVIEVSDVVNGKELGRETENERIIAYNVGISLHDIYFASRIYELLIESENLINLPEIEMKIPLDKYWV